VPRVTIEIEVEDEFHAQAVEAAAARGITVEEYLANVYQDSLSREGNWISLPDHLMTLLDGIAESMGVDRESCFSILMMSQASSLTRLIMLCKSQGIPLDKLFEVLKDPETIGAIQTVYASLQHLVSPDEF